VCSHLADDDLKDVILFSMMHSLLKATSQQKISQLVIWRKVLFNNMCGTYYAKYYEDLFETTTASEIDPQRLLYASHRAWIHNSLSIDGKFNTARSQFKQCSHVTC